MEICQWDPESGADLRYTNFFSNPLTPPPAPPATARRGMAVVRWRGRGGVLPASLAWQNDRFLALFWDKEVLLHGPQLAIPRVFCTRLC